MKPLSVLGVVLASTAILSCLVLGSVGWLAAGMGVLTGCTNDYSCSTTGCDPCAAAGRWITVGGVLQWLLLGLGIAVVVRGRRADRRTWWAAGGAAVLAASLLTVVATTWAAQESYCRPGTPGYADSYCSVGSVRAPGPSAPRTSSGL